ncbi:amidohydrolase family protein [Ilumatobacter coccineus]|uniref:Putative decarboxylase n=1 Tax=Ilumatobacter coccineus (strain NBRC 103263 / KCTC 29153 / YM16-304) TaxID=1313172 RepID=A0A6C7EE70_ILUCY|nr:amidohydrolase family protein [Ilumatobacter coccineus]BAN04563.1 putative decarboxylase [Ilumatobacter coccineus YM16-304]
MTLLDDPRPISADSHAVETAETYEGLAEKFGDDAPRVVHKGEQGDYIEIPNQPRRSRNVAVMCLAGTRLDYATPLPREHATKPGTGSISDPEVQAYFTGGYAAMRPGLRDGARRPDDQDIDGISAEVLYPGWFPMFSLPDLELLIATQRNYNDWMADQQVKSGGRLVGLAALPVQDPEAALAELHRAIDLGFKGIVIPSNAPRDRKYSDADYDPMWSLAEEAGMPIGFHVACMSHVPDWLKAMGSRDPVVQYAGSPTLIHDTMVELMVRGVCAKFPRLRFVLAEFNAGWVAHWLDKAQQGWAREFAKDDSIGRPVDLLEVWKRQFFATIEDDTAALGTREMIGEETLLWGSDYPHTDSTWPCSTQVLDEMFETYSPASRDKITRTNVADLYSL